MTEQFGTDNSQARPVNPQTDAATQAVPAPPAPPAQPETAVTPSFSQGTHLQAAAASDSRSYPAQMPAAPGEPAVAPNTAFAPSNPAPAAAAAPAPAATAPAPSAEKPRRMWPAMAMSALLAAVLASGGTALATGAFDEQASGSAAYSELGSTTEVAASSTNDVEWQALASQVRDSVVAITVVTASGEGAGSGVVIDAENGYIVTNDHVVGDATTGGITVTLADGQMISATIVGTDSTTDIAVIKLDEVPSDLQAASWGSSSDVLVGQDVMAVGNPLGLASTVTTGIVSAVDRPVSTSGDTSATAVVTNAIQIDAAINPGNSGGPLFNTNGEVIGINSSIATTSSESGSIGLGFAIPSNQAADVAAQLIEDGTAEHAYLGVTLSDATVTADGVTRAGAQVEQVYSDTPAQAAGLQAGDVIVGINAKAVGGAEALTGFVRQYAAGDEVTLTVIRDGEAMDINATLAVREESDTTTEEQAPESGSDEDYSELPSMPGMPGGGFGGQG